MAKLLRSLPIFTLRPNLKPLSHIPISTTLIPFSLSSLKFNLHSSISHPTHCNTTSVPVSSSSSSALHATEQQTREPDPFESAKETNLEWVSRTDLCGHLGEDDVGKRVTLCGWVALHRVHGGLTFVSLRDHSGIVQVMIYFSSFLI